MTPSAAAAALDRLNEMDRAEFTTALGGVFEDSPWVADRAWPARPFASWEHLHRTMMAAIGALSPAEKVEFLGLHPDLAGKAARTGTMSAASVGEQASAGLRHLDDDEYERFERINRAYRNKFGFPFIIAVRNHTKQTILAAYAKRLENSKELEIERAIEEVGAITRLRLEAIAGGAPAR